MSGILIHSNAPWTNTGYGNQVAALAPAIKASGRPVTLSTNFGLAGGISAWQGMEVLPTGYDTYSTDVLQAHHDYTEHVTQTPTALLTLFDVWVYKATQLDKIKAIYSWLPIDHDPTPPEVIAWCQRSNVTPIAMSKFGHSLLSESALEPLYAPHSVSTDIYCPLATVNDQDGRALLSVPADAFLVGMVAANKGINPNRKAWAENLLAIGKLMRERDDVWLYVHAENRGNQGGIDLLALAYACNIPAKRLIWVDQWAQYAGINEETMAAIVASFDVELLCSRGEGFGVPTIEAAACGVPSIVSNYTAQPELVEGFGWTADVQPYWDSHQRSWFATPIVDSIVECLLEAYDKAKQPARRAAAREHAMNYDHELVFTEHWLPILQSIDDRLGA